MFLEIFPELSHAQEELQHSDILLVQYLENHVYILALIGLLVFYVLNFLTPPQILAFYLLNQGLFMDSQFTAIIKKDGDWWIG